MRNNKGFTLVELAVVLVIIGIILGAVIKGQDLIENARSKQFTNNIKSWQIALSVYFDRKGRYPGDPNKTGIIGTSGTLTPNVKTDLDDAKFTTPPPQAFNMGQNTYYVFVGNDGGTPKKNIIKICVADDCDTEFNDEALKMAESFNTAMVGSADAKGTTVYGVTGTGTVAAATYLVTAAGDKAAVGTDWLTYTTIKGLVYVLQ